MRGGRRGMGVGGMSGEQEWEGVGGMRGERGRGGKGIFPVIISKLVSHRQYNEATRSSVRLCVRVTPCVNAW